MTILAFPKPFFIATPVHISGLHGLLFMLAKDRFFLHILWMSMILLLDSDL